MEQITTTRTLTEWVNDTKASGKTIGLVPTMGSLHAGHLSLVDASVKDCDTTITSLFVNPLQFAPHEDFDSYPRQFEGDKRKLNRKGNDVLFAPEREELYPSGALMSMRVEPPKSLNSILCSVRRPHFFGGVSTVVLKLLNIAQSDRAYFGEKDYQQLCIIRHLAKDLHLRTQIIGVPTVRERDGLALSSRNQYLTASERRMAARIHQELKQVECRYMMGDAAEMATQNGFKRLQEKGFFPEYLEIRENDTLVHGPDKYKNLIHPVRLLVAAKLGETRLIDNIIIEPPKPDWVDSAPLII